MAAIVASRKRSASPFLDEAFPAPPHLAKRVRRFTPCAAVVAPPPLQQQQPSTSSREAAASRISRAAATDNNGAGMDECAAVLVEQMAAANDLADAKSIASWILALFKDAVAAAAMREENAALKVLSATESAAALKEENDSLKAHAAQSSAEIAELREEIAATKAQAAALERDKSAGYSV
ncbi:hypothetical protein PR202_ga06832 [Eleusine coracana subsp. coracana]|uniref:Uncharacterized protein n=1 Tax=Eleusine coracana subsp. coracana TaxID=191504 RepID=A0AAV5BY81_ELECO|nr:hypothetical protein QOZ80_2AG0105370 [Eleusine coracana subsp. coracana]GJM90543.1 hypothetical protein PR202_ga06832 [Eleusine coracana subsp. coracana]